MNNALKSNLKGAVTTAKSLDDIKLVLHRLIDSIEAEEEKAEKFLKTFVESLNKINI